MAMCVIFIVDMDMLPSVGEILFNTDHRDGQATMAWSYKDPRVITNIHATPLPFNTPQWLDARYVDETLKVGIPPGGTSQTTPGHSPTLDYTSG